MPAHHPPGTTTARHARAPQTPHTQPPACACHKSPCPHATVRPQVPPTASHCVPPLRARTATTHGPTLQPRPLGLPWRRTPPHPLPPLRGPQRPPPRAARGPSRHPPPLPATPASSGHSPTPCWTTWEGTTWLTQWTIAMATGYITPAAPQPAPAPQRRRLKRGGPPHPSRPPPPPP